MTVGGSSSVARPHYERSRGQSLNENVEVTPLAPVEPSADIRGMAGFCRQLYTALLEQHFTPDQALDVVGRAVQGVCTGIDLSE